MMTKPHILNPSFQDCWHSREWLFRIPPAEHLPQRHAGPHSAIRASCPSRSSCQNRTGNPNIRNLQSAIGPPRFLPAHRRPALSSPPPASLRFCVLHPHIPQPGPEGASSILKKPEIATHLLLPLCFMRHLLRLKILENPNFFPSPPFLGRRGIPLPPPANPVPLLCALRALCGELVANRNAATPARILSLTNGSTFAMVMPKIEGTANCTLLSQTNLLSFRLLCGSRNHEGIPVCSLVEKVLENTGISTPFRVQKAVWIPLYRKELRSNKALNMHLKRTYLPLSGPTLQAKGQRPDDTRKHDSKHPLYHVIMSKKGTHARPYESQH